MNHDYSGPDDHRYFEHLEQATAAVTAPFLEWAETGFAEGVLSFQPSPAKRPSLLSSTVLNDIWESVFSDYRANDISDDERTEASARFEFAYALVNRLTVRESEMIDLYYRGRRNGMMARTVALATTVFAVGGSAIAFPWWASATMAFPIGVFIGRAAKRYRAQVRRASRPPDAAALILAALPWRQEGVARAA